MKRVSLERFSRVVAAIHEAAAAPEQWPDALGGIIELFEASKGAVFDIEAQGLAGVIALGHAPQAQKAYAEHYFAVDPTMHACLALPANQPSTVYEHFPRAVRSRGEYFAFARSCDIGDVLGVGTRAERGRRCIVSLQRPLTAADFDQDAKRLMALLAPHLEIAKRVQRKLAEAAAARDVLAAGLDRFQHPAIIVDARGVPCHMNAAADRLLARDTRVRCSGRLSFAAPGLAAAFEAALKGATGPGARVRWFALPSTAAKPGAEVVVAPLHARHPLAAPWQHPLALVVIAQSREDASAIAARMRQLYGLTPAESRVVALLALGRTVEEIAAVNRVSEATLRSQLRSIRLKTGVSRQADVVRLALAGAPFAMDADS